MILKLSFALPYVFFLKPSPCLCITIVLRSLIICCLFRFCDDPLTSYGFPTQTVHLYIAGRYQGYIAYP